MSYQVLYILSRTEVPPTAAGTCVCSTETPEPLLKELRESTRLRRTAWGQTAFLYRTLEAGEKIYHVMTCMNGTEGGVLVHHLAFTEAETAVLRREDMRPTPAGIMAALQQEKFWPQAALPDAPPHLSIDGEALPTPAAQPTWKRLTGHKSTAKRLIESPFDARCALILPRTAESADVLRLLHESDWLTGTCGWGVSFCTAADEEDVNTTLRRIACAEGSAAERVARRAGIPCFTVRKEQRRLTPTRAYRPEYVYTEEDDACFYPVARKISRETKRQMLWGLLAATPVAAVLTFIGRPYLPPIPLPRLPSAIAPGALAEQNPTAAPIHNSPTILAMQSDTGTLNIAPQNIGTPAEPAAPTVLQHGSELPPELNNGVGEESALTQGELRIGLLGADGCTVRPLSDEHPALFTRDAAGFSLRYHAKDAPLELRITVSNGTVEQVSLNGTPAAADFTLPNNGQRLIFIPRIEAIDGGQAALKEPPPTWPPKRYIPCDKLLAPTPPTEAYPYGKLQIGRGVPPVPAEGLSCKINFPLTLPDLGCPNIVSKPQNELPTAYRYRWKQRTGNARLTVELPLAEAVQQGFDRRMNAYCGGTAGEGDSFFSLATLYGIVSRLEIADLPAEERAAALGDYMRLFRETAFRRLVKEEILPPADHALCPEPEGAAEADSPRMQETDALLTPANCFKIREAVAQQVLPALATAYETAVQALPPAPHPVLQLHRVTLLPDGSLQWDFRLIPAP